MNKKPFSYTVTEIYKNTWLIDEHFSSMFVLVGKKRALVIDCGVGAGDFLSVIKSITDLPFDVALTHSHVDHAGGRGQFNKIYVSKEDAPYIKEVNIVLRKGYSLISRFTLGEGCHGAKLQAVKHEPKTEFIYDGFEFDLGERPVKVIKTPGHTVGSVSFLDINNRVLFDGDIANEFLLMYLPHATTLKTLYDTHTLLSQNNDYDIIWSSHHTKSQTKNDLEIYRTGVKNVLNKYSRNTLLPIIKTNDCCGAKLLYRTSRIR